MNAFFAQLMAGLATGGIYASLALALVMIYRSTHHVNFAQGEMAMFSTFIASMLITAGWPYWAALGVVLLLVLWQFRLARARAREGCFAAFLHNNWVGMTVFLGIAVGLAVR